MPTIIALDVSLSMHRHIPGREENALTYFQLATKGISQFLEHFVSSKLEYCALCTYSSSCDLKVDFTRDYEQIKQAVKKSEQGDKSCPIGMIKFAGNVLTTSWPQNFCQVVAFTDSGIGFGQTSIKTFLEDFAQNEKDTEFAWIAPLRGIKYNFICMGVHSDTYFQYAHPLYQKFFDVTGLKGQVYTTKLPKELLENCDNSNDGSSKGFTNLTNVNQPMTPHKSELGRTAMLEIIDRLCEANYKPFEANLKCGSYFRLECPIIIWPPPLPYQGKQAKNSTKQTQNRTISTKIEVCGFLSLSDIGSPASLSRHLIIPKVEREKHNRRCSDKSTGGSNTSSVKSASKLISDVNQPNHEFEKLEQEIRDFYTKESKDTDESGDDAEATKSSASTTAPNEMQKESVCVLLHGALKVENLAALVQLGDSWYGFIYSFADTRRKSNLMLNILPPGTNVIPWLGELQLLGFADNLMPGEPSSTFPVKSEKRSYTQNCVVWIRKVSLQSDVQKILRHAKKMPEKIPHFYKELNRIRRAALSIGFVELLEAMATLFDRESASLSINAHPECSIQLKHAAMELRNPSNLDINPTIMPVQQSGSNSNTAGFIY